MFTAALYATAKTQKQPKCLSTDEQIKKMWGVSMYTHTHVYNEILAIKKNEIMPFAAKWMDLEIIILCEVSQIKTNIMISLICGVNKKNNTSEIIYKTGIYSQTQRTNLCLPKEKVGQG